MQRSITLALALTACTPVGSIDRTDTAAITPDESSTETEDPTDYGLEEDARVPLAGVWRLEYSRTTLDECGFDAYLDGLVSSVMADLYMPETFTVESDEDRFFIIANDYGSRGPIACDVVGETFTCETQTADSAIGWTYAIDFSGTVHEDDEIRGTSVVRYVSVDPYSEGLFAGAGVDYTACSTTHLMELRWADW